MKVIVKKVSFDTDSFIDAWISKFRTKYKKYLPDIIDAFVEYYGEEYRDYISTTIKNINIDFYLSELALKAMKENPSNRVILSKLKDYINKLNREMRINYSKGFLKNKIFRDYANKCIKTQGLIDYNFFRHVFKGNIISFMYSNYINDEAIKGIYFVIYALSNEDFIHELNHTILQHLDYLLDGIPQFREVILTEEVLELLNHIVTLDITSIFCAKGVSFLSAITDVFYNDKLFLVSEFYQAFKDIIKKALVTGDTNLLEKKLGKSNLDKFCRLVKKLYYQENVSESDIKRISFLVSRMRSNLESEQDCDYESYYEELKSRGYRVRILSDK